jgi:hypothetical protein
MGKKSTMITVPSSLTMAPGKEIELSRKDMTSFFTNGSVSKEFILKNKLELQKFIKT